MTITWARHIEKCQCGYDLDIIQTLLGWSENATKIQLFNNWLMHNMLGVEVLIYSVMPTCLVLKVSGKDKFFEADWIAKNMATAWVRISILTNSNSKGEVPET